MLYRRFGYLFARVLLNKQDHLRRLEDELDKFDKANEDFAVTTEPNRISKPVIDSRNALLENIDTALAGYGRDESKPHHGMSLTEIASSLSHAQRLMNFNKPSNSEQQSVEAYLDNHKPVKKDERAYAEFKEDLVTLRPGREHAWLDRMIEASLQGAQKPFPFIHV